MFDKHLDVDKRIEQWRSVRKNSSSEQHVLENFSNIKVLSRYIDYWTPEEWPNPFEILEYGYFCTTGISILLYHTLANLNYINTELVEWKVISNHTNGQAGAIFICNGYYYNLIPGRKVSSDEAEEYFTTLKDLHNLNISVI